MDRFEQRVEENSKKIQECQKERGFVKLYGEIEYSSCTLCPDQIECKLRLEYVSSVYRGMSKEKSGGFEF